MIDNVVAGLTLLDSGYNSISGNQIEGNGRYGLQIQSNSDGNTIIDNAVSNSQTGIFLYSDKNLIYGNKILYNVIQAEDRGENSWNGSYPLGATSGATTMGMMSTRGRGRMYWVPMALAISPMR